MSRQVPYPHPGEILAEEFLLPLGITPYRLAKAIHVPLTRVLAIIEGKRAITADTGLRLAAAFGLSEGFFTSLQADFDAALVKDAIGEELANIERFALAA